MYKLRMKVGKINCILWNNHLFFQWHRKKHPKCTLESYFEFVLLARHRKCQDKVSQFSIVKGEEKGNKTVEALKTRLTSVQTARRIFMHYLYHSKRKFCLASITILVSKIFLQLWHNSKHAEAEEKGNFSHFGQDQLAHPCPLTAQGITQILTNTLPEQAASCSTTKAVSVTEHFPDISLLFPGSASIPALGRSGRVWGAWFCSDVLGPGLLSQEGGRCISGVAGGEAGWCCASSAILWRDEV